MQEVKKIKYEVDEALDKLAKIENFCKSYSRQMLSAERLAILTVSLFETE